MFALIHAELGPNPGPSIFLLLTSLHFYEYLYPYPIKCQLKRYLKRCIILVLNISQRGTVYKSCHFCAHILIMFRCGSISTVGHVYKFKLLIFIVGFSLFVV